MLQALTSEERRKILLGVASALEANEQFIMLENDADVETAREAGYDEALVARLALKPSKASPFTPILFLRILFCF